MGSVGWLDSKADVGSGHQMICVAICVQASMTAPGWVCMPGYGVMTAGRSQPCHPGPDMGGSGGNSEQELVCGKACVCGGCGVGHYCSRPCLTQHWGMRQLL